jgi:transposase
LEAHIGHLGEDRFKKGARAVINFALNAASEICKKSGHPYPPADVLLVEKLEPFIPDDERETGINRALSAWNRGKLTRRIEQTATEYGLKVVEIPSFGTSQVCSRCGRLGRRYSIRYSENTNCADVEFGFVEKLFACLCGYRANADHNASVNLHRRFGLGNDAVRAFSRFSRQQRQQWVSMLETALRPGLRRIHDLKRAALSAGTPF